MNRITDERITVATRLRLPALALAAVLVGSACIPRNPAPSPPTPTPTETATPSPSPTPTPSPSAPPGLDAPVVDGATYEDRGDVRVVKPPAGACTDVTATPVVVGATVVFGMHEKGRGCADTGPYGHSLLGYHTGDGLLHELASGAGTEGTPTYDTAGGVLFWPVLTGGAVQVLSADTFANAGGDTGIAAVNDAAGTVLGGLYYFGTVNTPFPPCQGEAGGEPEDDCGALYAVDATGTVRHRLDVHDGVRLWMTAGPTTDGTSLFAGGGTQQYGADDSEYRYGCSALRLGPGLALERSADPGDPGCREVGPLESAVVGEMPIGPDGSVWAQFLGPNDSAGNVDVVHYSRDLDEICRARFPTLDAVASASFYQAPTVDRDGNAYVTFTLPLDGGERRGVLYRVSPSCAATELARVDGGAKASPTLVDDRAVLLATDGKLLVVSAADGHVEREIALGSEAPVTAAPVVADGTVYVVATDATLSIVRNTGLDGYGTAAWPRFRHDNNASASTAGG